MHERQHLLASLPSVDEILKSAPGVQLLQTYPRKFVLQGIREGIDQKRREILAGIGADLSSEVLLAEIESIVADLSSYSLKPVINATGVVIHTNLGRSVLSERALENIKRVSESYSNLEYDIEKGRRGKRYVHVKRILREITGGEDALVVNNNAAAVLLCLNTLSKGREVIVSRGELVEIGGSFRMPDVMASSGAMLREVGTTNKTHLHDYEQAINERTSLIMKIHRSNFRIVGFTDDVPIDALVSLGERYHIPVMFDLGSGCLLDLKPYGLFDEPSVQEIVKTGVDLVTFSGDKLLGGPQGGVIIGKRAYVEALQKNPLTRALRIDKLTLAGFEATLMDYLDEERALASIPTLRMLLQGISVIKARAQKLAKRLRKETDAAVVRVMSDTSRAGGGALPEQDLPTFAVAVKANNMSVNDLEEKLRKGTPAIITRIKDDALILDARTIFDRDIPVIAERIRIALS